ncbi:leucine-rich repeat domain-containing protein [Christensenellaceae bacterium OttesenSCG-928-K19]|nr:leucine-rich repeat domain-containing protein [Christensenellaceae bacterium OttesenSCG-928-K19]
MRKKLKMVWVAVALLLLVLIPLQSMAQTTQQEAESPDLTVGTVGQDESAEIPAETSDADVPAEGEADSTGVATEEATATIGAQSDGMTTMANYSIVLDDVFGTGGFRAAVNQELKRLYSGGNPQGISAPDNANGVDYDSAEATDLDKCVMLSNADDSNGDPIPIDGISGTNYLTAVATIKFTTGNLSNIGALTYMPLVELTLENCKLGANSTNLGVLNASNFPYLKELSLKNNGITDEVAQNLHATTVETLDISGNEITSIDFLSTFTKLKTLDMSNNGVGSLAPLQAVMTTNSMTVTAENQSVVVDVKARGAGQKFEFENVIVDTSGNYAALTNPSPSGASYDSAQDPPLMVWPSLPQDTGIATVDFASVWDNPSGSKLSFTGALQINYEKESFKITYVGNDKNGDMEGTLPTDSTQYLRNEQATVMQPGTMTIPGSTFMNWSTQEDGEGTTYAPGVQITMTADVTLYAQWQQKSYVITATAGENGSITGSGEIKVKEGEDYIFTFTPNAGYEVSGVAVDGNTISGTRTSYTFENVRENHTIQVWFAVEGSSTGSGATSPQTDDDTDVMKWLLVITICLGAMAVAWEYRRGAADMKRQPVRSKVEGKESRVQNEQPKTRMERRRKK